MTLSNYHNYIWQFPDYILIASANNNENWLQISVDMEDRELDLRNPDEATYYFGDCEGQPVFLPIIEYDSNDNEIVSEMIGYDEGKEIWR